MSRIRRFLWKEIKGHLPTKYLREMLYFILSENSFQYCGSNYLQTHGTVMGAKIAVAFANIFMARIETKYRGRVVLNRLNSCFGNYILTMNIRGTQREYISKPLKRSTVKRILVFKDVRANCFCASLLRT